jgi:hypothetical protein
VDSLTRFPSDQEAKAGSAILADRAIHGTRTQACLIAWRARPGGPPERVRASLDARFGGSRLDASKVTICILARFRRLGMLVTALVIGLWALVTLGTVVCPKDSTADPAD